MPTFYALPKTHKCIDNLPSRPIVSGIGSRTSKASNLIDDYLRPHVESLPSYLKDTIHLLTILLMRRQFWPPLMWRHFILVSHMIKGFK